MVFTRFILPHSTITPLAWYKQVYQAIMKDIKDSTFNPDYLKVYQTLLSCLKQNNVEESEVSEFITIFPILCKNTNCLNMDVLTQCIHLLYEIDSTIYSVLRGLFM